MDEYNRILSKLEAEISGFREYFEEIIDFYKVFFKSYQDLEEFLFKVYSFPEDPVTETVVPRIMMNTVQRLFSLSDDMESVRPQKSALKIFFIVVCIESLYFNANLNNGLKKYEIIIDFFEKFILEVYSKGRSRVYPTTNK